MDRALLPPRRRRRCGIGAGRVAREEGAFGAVVDEEEGGGGGGGADQDGGEAGVEGPEGEGEWLGVGLLEAGFQGVERVESQVDG